jgi:hypothetical protein
LPFIRLQEREPRFRRLASLLGKGEAYPLRAGGAKLLGRGPDRQRPRADAAEVGRMIPKLGAKASPVGRSQRRQTCTAAAAAPVIHDPLRARAPRTLHRMENSAQNCRVGGSLGRGRRQRSLLFLVAPIKCMSAAVRKGTVCPAPGGSLPA